MEKLNTTLSIRELIDDFANITLQPKEVNTKFSSHEPNDDLANITLRPFELTDIDDYMEWATDDNLSEFWETCTSREVGLESIQRYIHHPWCQAICIENQPIGAISLTPNMSVSDQCRGELGYVLAYRHWGKGIVTEVVRRAIIAVFNKWPRLQRIEALVDVDNLASQKVLMKNGFVKEGVLRKFRVGGGDGRCRDFSMFSFLSSDLKS